MRVQDVVHERLLVNLGPRKGRLVADFQNRPRSSLLTESIVRRTERRCRAVA